MWVWLGSLELHTTHDQGTARMQDTRVEIPPVPLLSVPADIPRIPLLVYSTVRQEQCLSGALESCSTCSESPKPYNGTSRTFGTHLIEHHDFGRTRGDFRGVLIHSCYRC